jgi:hypothetical protein
MRGADLAYAQVRYEREGWRARAFMHWLRGADLPNLLSVDPTGRPIRLDFDTKSFDVSASRTWVLGAHAVTAGGNFRRNVFTRISTAPAAPDRSQGGAYLHSRLQWERLALDLAGRLDKSQSVSGVMFSPRAALLFRPVTGHVLRVAGGQSQRVPTAVDQHIDISVIGGVLPLALIDPSFGSAIFPFVVRSTGAPDVRPESRLTVEAAYTAAAAPGTMGITVWRSRLNDPIALVPSSPYSSLNVPAGWPLPGVVLDALAAQGVVIPSEIRTLNLGPLDSHGLEASWSRALAGGVTGFANYSWQSRPRPAGVTGQTPPYPPGLVSVPPSHRFNAGASYDRNRWLGSATISRVSSAFWSDVLTPAFWGPTESYTLVGATIGVRVAPERLTILLKGTNIYNQSVQQHVFGDIFRRVVSLEAVIGM